MNIHGCTSRGLFNTLLPRFSASMPLSPTYLATWFTLLTKTCSYLSPYNPARGRLRWLNLGCSSAHSRTQSLQHCLFNTLLPRFFASMPLSPTNLATWFTLLSKTCSYLSPYNPARGRLRWLDLDFSSAH